MRTDLIRPFKAIIMAAALAVVWPSAVVAQEYVSTPVTISKEKLRVNGKVCYSHIVLEKQTLYSISKAYNVGIEDIYRFNPTLKENTLKKNAIIIIPSQEALEDSRTEKKNTATTEMATQTVQSAVTQGDSYRTSVPQEDQQKKTKKRTHVVKWYEDLNVIAEKYGVSVESIMQANNLTGKKLINRQKLVIPDAEAAAEAAGNAEEAQKPVAGESQSQMEETAEVPAKEAKEDWHLFPKGKVNATLLLPLRAIEGTGSRSSMDFYSGMLLAARDLGEEGISSELNVYDVADGRLPVTRERIQSSDLIIGPVSSGDMGRLFGMFPEAKAVISPLDPRVESLVADHSDLIQVPTPHKVQYEDLASWIKEDRMEGDKVIIISEKGARDNVMAGLMKAAADSAGLSYSTFSYSILEGRDIMEPLSGLMTMEGTNRVLIASESEAFVNEAVRNLNLMIHNKYNVVLYGPSKIRSFETIEVENFHNTSLHVSLSYYIDYDDPRVKSFLLRYRALFGTEPNQFAFQGYDIASYFITLSHKYGSRWPEMLETSDKAMLQCTFKCRKDGNGGYVNKGVRRIIYGKGWTVTEVE